MLVLLEFEILSIKFLILYMHAFNIIMLNLFELMTLIRNFNLLLTELS